MKWYRVWLPPGSRSKTSVATIATQNYYVATLCDRNNCAILRNLNQICCDFARPKKRCFATIATQNGYAVALRDFARTKTNMMRLCGTEKGMLRPLRLKKGMLWLCATKNRYDATLRDPKKVWCGHCDSKNVCNVFARPKTDMMRLCATQKSYVAAIVTQNGYVVTRFIEIFHFEKKLS